MQRWKTGRGSLLGIAKVNPVKTLNKLLHTADGRWREVSCWIAVVGLVVMMGPVALAQAAPASVVGRVPAAVKLTPDLPSGQPVGAAVTWTGNPGDGAPHIYRFSVAPPGGPFSVVLDYQTRNTFRWTPGQEGIYSVRVSVRDGYGASGTTEATAPFKVVSRVNGGVAIVTPTDNPLVALYSAPPCFFGRVRVEYKAAEGTSWQSTDWIPCRATKSANFYVAGMAADTRYSLRHVVQTGSSREASTPIPFRTGSPTVALPRFTPRDLPDPGTLPRESVIFHSPLVYLGGLGFPIATDPLGRVVWYYYDNLLSSKFGSYTTRVLPGGKALLILSYGDKASGDGLREVDLAGNIKRETNLDRINEQLAARGDEKITNFHHELAELPNGQTAVLANVERLMTDVQGAAGQVNILGNMIIVLDQDWQVVWTLNAFDHLDVNRKATLDEKCGVGGNPGCPTLTLAPAANDWLHMNSIAYSPQDKNLIVSIRNQDWVIKIDYRDGAGSGAVLWRLGKDGDFRIDSSDPYPWFSHQHDASYIGPNQILLFDNGSIRCQGQESSCNSRGQVVEIDEGLRVANLRLNADLGVYSATVGSAQKLPVGGGFFFDAGGMQPFPTGQNVQVRLDGTRTYVLQTRAALYRSQWMQSPYGP